MDWALIILILSAENYLEMIENVTRQMDVAYENYQRNDEKSDEGLVPMLRTGMIALQLLPSNCLAGVVVFTDGCTDVYVDQEMIFEPKMTNFRKNFLRNFSTLVREVRKFYSNRKF